MYNNKNAKFQHDESLQEFSLNINGAKAFISYSKEDGIIYLNHTEVPASLRGQGVGKMLVERTYEYIQEKNLQAVAVCSYAKSVSDRINK